MQITNTIHSIKDFFSQLFTASFPNPLEQESPREKKTKKYTQKMIKKYGKTLRRLSKE